MRSIMPGTSFEDVRARRLESGARGNMRSRFGHASAMKLEAQGEIAAATSYLLEHVELGGPIWTTLEPMAEVLRVRYGISQVVSLGGQGLRSVVAMPGLGDAEAEITRGLDATLPLRGAVAMLLPHAFDAIPHGGVLKHPSFHAKLVCTANTKGPVMAWYCWLHRMSLQGRKGGARVIYP